MFVPPAFLESDLPTLHGFIERNSFGLLVSQHDGSPFATHLPFLLERNSGDFGTLLGHVARANPQWEQCLGQQVMVVFTGPHAYVSPTWYEAEHVVPTWNYVTVHAFGQVQLVEDQLGLHDIVRRSVEVYERSMPRPWSLGESDTFVERLLKQIVGFRIEIERLEGKWKLNQNHPVERREKVVRALSERGDENSSAIAALMRQQLGEGALNMEREVGSASQFQLLNVSAEQAELVAPLFDAYRQFYGQPPDIDGARQFLAERLGRGESVILAVVEGGRALGFTQLYPSFSSVSMKPIWILNDLYVAEDARRKGVGARLLRAAREHAVKSGAARLVLSTAVTNTTAQALYERDGWRRDDGFFHYEYDLPKDGH